MKDPALHRGDIGLGRREIGERKAEAGAPHHLRDPH